MVFNFDKAEVCSHLAQHLRFINVNQNAHKFSDIQLPGWDAISTYDILVHI